MPEQFVSKLLELGPAGLICVVLWIALYKSEQREAKKDMRIQMLENQLIESYDERIVAADRIAEALLSSKNALDQMRSDIRERLK